MAVLVIADHDNASLKDNTHKTVSAAQAISGDVDVLVAGKGAQAAADAAAKISGVRKVLLAESDALGQGLAEAFEQLVVGLAGGYDAVLSPATSLGKNIAPRIAAKLDSSPISEIIEVVDANTVKAIWRLQDIVHFLDDRTSYENFDIKGGEEMVGAGYYYDRYEKVGDEWLIASTGYERIFEYCEPREGRPGFKLLVDPYLGVHQGNEA